VSLGNEGSLAAASKVWLHLSMAALKAAAHLLANHCISLLVACVSTTICWLDVGNAETVGSACTTASSTCGPEKDLLHVHMRRK